MARRNLELEPDQDPRDPWGRELGDPEYGMPPGEPDLPILGGTPYGDPIDASLPPTGGTPPPPPPGPGPRIDPEPRGTPSFDLGPLLQGYPGSFQAPAYGQAFRNLSDLLGPVPEFSAPQLPTIAPFEYQSFTPTRGEDVFSDPSFGFRKDIGQDALMNSRAAQGLARTGGTLKDLLAYNQNFASQEFGNVDQRRRQTYDTNRGNAFQNWQANRGTAFDLYDRGFEGARAEFEPQLYGWRTKADLGTRAEEKAQNDAYTQFLDDYKMWRNQQSDVFDRLKWASEFGADVSD